MRGNILVIDDEQKVFDEIEKGLSKAHNLHYARNLSEIRNIFSRKKIDLTFVDLNIKLGGKDRFSGLEYIKTIRERYPYVVIITLSKHDDIERVSEASRNGADKYIYKGFWDGDSDEFREEVRVLINAKKKLDVERAKWLEDAWGEAEYTKETLGRIRTFSNERRSFFLIGENGLGKTRLLDRMYGESRDFKPSKPPVQIDLTGYTSSGLEKMLNHRPRPGKPNFFKQAHNGILFLRHIESLSLPLQEGIFKTIETRHFLNGKERLHCQMVFLLESDPEELIEQQILSPELYYGLDPIVLKPLRERRSKIQGLIQNWVKRHDYHKLPYIEERRESQKYRSIQFEEAVVEQFRHYDYPGNISQLYNLLGQTLDQHKKHTRNNWEATPVQVQSLPQELWKASDNLYEEMAYEVAKVELGFIEQAFQKYAGVWGSKGKVAKELKIPSGADNLKKTYISKYWRQYPELVRQFPAIMKEYKLDGK